MNATSEIQEMKRDVGSGASNFAFSPAALPTSCLVPIVSLFSDCADIQLYQSATCNVRQHALRVPSSSEVRGLQKQAREQGRTLFHQQGVASNHHASSLQPHTTMNGPSTDLTHEKESFLALPLALPDPCRGRSSLISCPEFPDWPCVRHRR